MSFRTHLKAHKRRNRNSRSPAKPSDQKSNERRPALRKITLAELKKAHTTLLRKYADSPPSISNALAYSIVRRFLGNGWVEKYVDSDSRYASYLRVDVNAPITEKAKALLRYWEFAETLLNLQHQEGFEAVLDEFSFGKIESACAELDIARLIHVEGLKFRFVKRTQTTKGDYDYEISYPDGFEVCADAKAKFETTEPNAKSVTESLKKARRQLPDDRLSVILVKVPENWIKNPQLNLEIVGVANDYLRQSNHVASVKFYASMTVCTDTFVGRLNAFKEVSNLKFPDRNWDMFTKWPQAEPRVPRDGMPDWWIRITPRFKIPE